MYKCTICGGEFEAGWSEEEALAEMKDNFGEDTAKEQCEVFCDDCFKKPTETKTLERMRIYIFTIIDEKLLGEFAGPRTTEVSVLGNFVADQVVFKLRQEILGNTLEEVSVKYPSTWWDAFKDRFLKRFTKINYIRVKLTARELYPKLAFPDLDPHILLGKTKVYVTREVLR